MFTCKVLKFIISRPWPIMLEILPIMFLSSAQEIAHYAQYYAHES